MALLFIGWQVIRTSKCCKCIYYTRTGVLISPSPDQEGNKLGKCQGRARFQQHRDASCHQVFDVEYIYGFVMLGGLEGKSMTSPRTSQRNRHACAHTIVTLQQQDGGYALLWKHYDNNNMAATCYYGNNKLSLRVYCCCCRCILHLQQYSRRLNLFLFFWSGFEPGSSVTT